MKIIRLEIANIKNIKAINIHPDDTVILEGRCGAGKSAVLDAIMLAITGKKMETPIRNGEERAEINIDLGEYHIKRVITDKTDRLEVTSPEGASFKSPQKMLNELFGNLSFDPLEFAEMGKNLAGQRQQRDILSKMVGLDFFELDKKRQDLFSERTIKNREIKGADSTAARPDPFAPLPLEALVAKMEKPAEGTPRVEISMADELVKLDAMESKRNSYLMACKEVEDENAFSIQTKKDQESMFASNIEESQRQQNILALEIEEMKKTLNAKIAELEAISQDIAVKENNLANLKMEVFEPKAMPAESITAAEIISAKESLKQIESKNIEIRKAIEFDKKSEALELARREIDRLEEEMMKIDLEKKNRIESAAFPIAGLGITEQFVTYENKPFSQLSHGEQIVVSTAIAMVLNPKLRVMFVRDGSLLDQAGTDALIKLAKEKDYQLFMEKTVESGKNGFYIEEGEIVSVKGETVKPRPQVE